MLEDFFLLINKTYPPPAGRNTSIIFGTYTEVLKVGFWCNEHVMTYIFTEHELSNLPKLMRDIASYIVEYDKLIR